MDKFIQDDKYNIERKKPTEAEIRLHLIEVENKCPLCGEVLQSNSQKKKEYKRYEIAHIYPNRPTKQQKKVFEGLERLGEDSEDFENKIALCKDCHRQYDFRPTKNEYLNLVEIKKRCLNKLSITESINKVTLEKELYTIIEKLGNCQENNILDFKYDAVSIDEKFLNNEFNIKRKIRNYIIDYFNFIQKLFNEIEENNKFNIIATEFKLCFLKINEIEKDKSKIFDYMVRWVKNKSDTNSTEACEAIVSFFVQNCEVFEKNETS